MEPRQERKKRRKEGRKTRKRPARPPCRPASAKPGRSGELPLPIGRTRKKKEGRGRGRKIEKSVPPLAVPLSFHNPQKGRLHAITAPRASQKRGKGGKKGKGGNKRNSCLPPINRSLDVLRADSLARRRRKGGRKVGKGKKPCGRPGCRSDRKDAFGSPQRERGGKRERSPACDRPERTARPWRAPGRGKRKKKKGRESVLVVQFCYGNQHSGLRVGEGGGEKKEKREGGKKEELSTQPLLLRVVRQP